MYRRLFLIAAACALSCSAVDDFSSFHFVYDGGVGDLAGGSDGGAGGKCTTSGQRLCVDAHASGRCEAGNIVLDRHCPSGSTCANGLCQPPSGASQCSVGRDCLTGVCVPFVDGSSLVGFCVPSTIGTSGGMYATCGPPFGDDSACATGLCADDAQRPFSTHQCLFLCAGGGDCPGGSCDGLAAPMTIEGVSTSNLHSCFM